MPPPMPSSADSNARENANEPSGMPNGGMFRTSHRASWAGADGVDRDLVSRLAPAGGLRSMATAQ